MADPRQAGTPESRGVGARGTEARTVSAPYATSAKLAIDLGKNRAAGELVVSSGAPRFFGIVDHPDLRILTGGRNSFELGAYPNRNSLLIRSDQGQWLFPASTRGAWEEVMLPLTQAKRLVPLRVDWIEPDPQSQATRLQGDLSLFDSNTELTSYFTMSASRVQLWIPKLGDGQSAQRLAEASVGHPERQAIALLYTQGWLEYRKATGQDKVLNYAPLGLRLIEQYQRGNHTARDNRLMVQQKATFGLGLYERDTPDPMPLYWSDGSVVLGRDGGPRDLGFVSFLGTQGRIVITIRNGRLADILLSSTKFAEVGIDQAKAVEALLRTGDVLFREVMKDWPYAQTLAKDIQDQFPWIVGFLCAETLAVALQTMPAVQVQLFGKFVLTTTRIGEMLNAVVRKFGSISLVFQGLDLAHSVLRLGESLRYVELEAKNGEWEPRDKMSEDYLQKAVLNCRHIMVCVSSFIFLWQFMKYSERFVAIVFNNWPPGPPGGLVPAFSSANGGRAGNAQGNAGPSNSAAMVGTGGGSGSSRPKTGPREDELKKIEDFFKEPKQPPKKTIDPNEPSFLKDLKFKPESQQNRDSSDSAKRLEVKVAEVVKAFCEIANAKSAEGEKLQLFQNETFNSFVEALIKKQLELGAIDEAGAKALTESIARDLLQLNRRQILQDKFKLGPFIAALESFFAQRVKAAQENLRGTSNKYANRKLDQQARDLVSEIESPSAQAQQGFYESRQGNDVDPWGTRERSSEADLPSDLRDDAIALATEKLLLRDLQQTLNPTTGRTKPDNVLVRENLAESAILDATEKPNVASHLLKLLTDRWLLNEVITRLSQSKPDLAPKNHGAGEVHPLSEETKWIGLDGPWVRDRIMTWFTKSLAQNATAGNSIPPENKAKLKTMMEEGKE